MEIIIILLLILLNGFFAMSEIAILTTRKSRLQKLANEGDKKAQKALELANNPNKFLSIVQIGITLISILAGAFGGTSLSVPLGNLLKTIPFIAPFSEFIAFILIVGIITYLTLIIGEIVPKRIALVNSMRIAMWIAGPMEFIYKIAAPMVSFLSFSTDYLLRLFQVKQSTDSQVSDEEIKLLISEGTRTGVFELAEKDIFERTLKLSDKKVNVVMTPRSEIDWLDIDSTFRKMRSDITKKSHAYYPVCRDSLDKVIGVIRTDELLTNFLSQEKLEIKQFLHKPLFVPESMSAFKLLEFFKKSGIHMALVIDEYGSIQGLVTLTDILEEIVGDIPSFDELEEKDILKRDNNSWLVNGLVSIDEFKEYFHVKKIPGEKTGLFHTIGGFVMNKLNKIPVTGDKTEWESYIFEIVDMDENRIDKILVTRV